MKELFEKNIEVEEVLSIQYLANELNLEFRCEDDKIKLFDLLTEDEIASGLDHVSAILFFRTHSFIVKSLSEEQFDSDYIENLQECLVIIARAAQKSSKNIQLAI